MATITGTGAAGRQVDLEQGIISREIFVSEEVYQQELEQIFARCWLFVGHESQVPKPDDYAIARMGEESVILTRDRQGALHVLLNTCRHRGMKVCRYDEGNSRVFSCPYHGWSYSTDGSLVSVPGELLGVPQYQTAYHGQLNKADWGLIPVAQMVNYKGAIFATWDAKAPSFTDYMGDMLVCLDDLLDCRDGRPGGSEVLGGVQKWRLPSNWKFATENFIGDSYHGISHRSEILVGTGPGGPGSERHAREDAAAERVERGSISFPELGHGTLGIPPHIENHDWFPTFRAPSGPIDNIPVVKEYFEEVKRERKRRIAGKTVVNSGVASVFPNMSYHSRFPRTIALWHPVSARVTEGWRFTLVDADAPKEVKDLLRHYSLRYSGPAGLTEEDDMENWNYASEASKGTIALRYPYNYAMGLGFEQPAEGLKGARFTPGVSEQNQRGFYRCWAQMMDASSWDELAPRREPR